MPFAALVGVVEDTPIISRFRLNVIRVALNLRDVLSLMLSTAFDMARMQFRIVVRRHLLIENADVLVQLQRLNLAYLKVACLRLDPYPIVAIFIEIARSKHRAEWLASEENDCGIRLAYTMVLLP